MTIKTWKFLPNTRSSHPVSKLLRPVLENNKLKTAVGGLMSVVGMSASSLWLVAGVYQSTPILAFSPTSTEAVIETEKQDYFHNFKAVVPSMSGVSQSFNRWHPGVDVTAPAGSKIYPVRAGKVIRIDNTKYGYGRSMLVDHGNGLVSLYAHLGKVMVVEGEVVETGTVLAEMGLTGRTTGYHLHLEVRDEGRIISPAKFLSTTVRLAHKI